MHARMLLRTPGTAEVLHNRVGASVSPLVVDVALAQLELLERFILGTKALQAGMRGTGHASRAGVICVPPTTRASSQLLPHACSATRLSKRLFSALPFSNHASLCPM